MNRAIIYLKQKVPLDFWLIVVISVVMGLCSVRSIDLPGLYMDAVNPDYLATGLFFHDYPNTCWLLPYIGFPLITQLYHGTVSFMIGSPVYLIFGASVESLRVLNMVYGLSAVILLYFIINKATDGNRWIAFATALCLATHIALLSSFRTQLYILLPGTICLLGAVYLLLLQKNDSVKYILISGILAGFAFYTYFVYLFFVPAFFILLRYQCKEKYLANVGKWLFGFAVGSSLYFVAYFSMMVVLLNVGKVYELLGLFLFIISWSIVIGIPFYFIYHNKKMSSKVKRGYIWFLIFLTAVGLAMLAILIYKGKIASCLAYLSQIVQRLEINGESTSFLGRVYLFARYTLSMLQNNTNESIIFGHPVSVLTGVYPVILGLMTIVSSYIIFKNNEYRKIGAILYSIVLFLISFGVTSLVFITRLGGHHFVSTLYIIFIILGIEAHIIFNYLKDIKKKNKIAIRAGVTVLALFLTVNFMNQGIFVEYLQRTGGIRMYSEQLNLLAENAVDNKRSGVNEIYIFPEWGFMMSFNFLTKNSVPYILEMDETHMQQIKEKDQTVKLCFWEKENAESYAEDLEHYGMDIISDRVYYSRDGQVAFYSMEAQYPQISEGTGNDAKNIGSNK